MIYRITFLSILVAFITACATTPIVEVSKPWTRTMGNAQTIGNPSKIYVSIEGSEEHLLLNNTLLESEIYSTIQDQLLRRNFEIVDDRQASDYVLSVNYHSEDIQVMRSTVTSYQNTRQNSSAGTSTGILAALAVSAQASESKSTSKAELTSRTAYQHTLGISIIDEDLLIWTGESTWESSNANILGRLHSVSQILLSNLPGYGEIIPTVPAVNSNKEENFYNIYVRGNNFVGPSLPYSINFQQSSKSAAVMDSKLKIEGVSDTRISYAVIDLIQTAEYAVPFNPDYGSPISTGQWNRVNLGGEYFIGDDTEPTNIIVELRGRQQGYTIKSAIIANQREYDQYLDQLNTWQNALETYYDVFE